MPQTFTILRPVTALKKIFSILILCCLAIYIGGYHLVYALYQSSIKQEMRAYLATHTDTRYGSYFNFKMEKNRIDDPLFNWEENNKEFRYKGEWYDVIAIQKSGDSIRISSIKDDRENRLEKQLAEIHQNKHNCSSTTSISFIKFFSLFYIPGNMQKYITHSGVITYFLTDDRNCLSINCQVSTPPPRC